jgi:nucleoside-diphosphate-sugar epimerase
MSRLLCFGFGYVAKALAEDVSLRNWTVTGTSRTPVSEAFSILQFDTNTPLTTKTIHEHTHILISIPPFEGDDLVFQQHRDDLLSHPNLQWVGYLSSTGVYGDKQGAWVDETSTCEPSDAITQARFKAEQQWLSLYKEYNLPVHIFRLSGIYGPGRSMVERVLAGTAQRIHKPGQYFSRIHVEDIVQVLNASMAKPSAGEIYNLADDEPCSSSELIEYVCDRLHLPYPPLIEYKDAQLSPMAARFYHDNRRVCNAKIKSQLGISLIYPTYREGLKL